MAHSGIYLLIFSSLVFFTVDVHAQEISAPPQPASRNAPVPDNRHEGHDQAGKGKRVVAVPGADGIQRVEIVGGDYYFDPDYVVLKANVPVEMTLKKAAGYVPHDIAVKAPEAGIDFHVELTKEPKTVKFTPVKAGKYEMICEKKLLFFKNHKDRGMHGMIEVVP